MKILVQRSTYVHSRFVFQLDEFAQLEDRLERLKLQFGGSLPSKAPEETVAAYVARILAAISVK